MVGGMTAPWCTGAGQQTDNCSGERAQAGRAVQRRPLR